MAKKKKILHVVYDIRQGGVWRWLLNTVKELSPDDYEIDIVILRYDPFSLKKDFADLGCNVSLLTGHTNPIIWPIKFFRLLLKNKYDVVHSSTGYHGGMELLPALFAGVKVRISESHSATPKSYIVSGFLKRIYIQLMQYLIAISATHRIGVSLLAGEGLYGRNWGKKQGDMVVWCGTDFSKLKIIDAVQKKALRASLSIPEDALVVGSVGRLSEEKNQKFAMEVLADLKNINSNAYLLLVGGGEFEKDLRDKASALQISDRVIFTGNREDIDALLQIMDIFIMPSFYEGLPIALVEAQAMGLRCIVSDSVTNEAHIIESLITFVPLSSGSKHWAEVILNLLSVQIPDAQTCLTTMSNTDFNVTRATKKLEMIYQQA